MKYLILLISCSLLFGCAIQSTDYEILAWQYKLVHTWSDNAQSPLFDRKLVEFMEDGKLQVSEYKALEVIRDNIEYGSAKSDMIKRTHLEIE